MTKLLPIAALLLLLLLVTAMFRQNADKSAAPAKSATGEAPLVTVQLLDDQGQLTGPMQVPAVVRSEVEWKARLTPEQYRIMREEGTERAFCGLLWDHHEEGLYACVGCGLPLFASAQKFESGTGWPSYWGPVAKENVATRTDSSLLMARTEILCARCGAHLGHVFDDGPPPSGQRYCLNSESLVFTPKPLLGVQPEGAHKTEVAYFAGGCFWGVEEGFRTLPGVVATATGYMGGKTKSPTYESVCSHTTGHAETVQVQYDPQQIDYADLLEVFFKSHDPTQKNRQGPDFGDQYRSAVFVHSPQQRELAEAKIKSLQSSGRFANPIVTEVTDAPTFWKAEDYHQQYLLKTGQASCHVPGGG
jgi:peptide methionine sulfoxide reductase msrA/msrB